MALENGFTLGHYEILAALGEGGMGEVYRARDPRLEREVAIKVLPDNIGATSFSFRDGDVSFRGGADVRLAELKAEARLLGALNHPNVATLFGLETQDDLSYLVMELVEGRTLAEEIGRGPLRIPQAIRIFIQIADGLEAAHERGIAHCDLKPPNVMVTPQGTVKILDFGVARALSRPANREARDPDESQTLTQPTLEQGAGTGTIQYMSPEQARGQPGDTRADIWAFGCCLFETLTGRRTFSAPTVSDILVRILDREPDYESLPEETPQRLRDLLRHCLSKETADRLRHIGDAGLELRDALEERGGAPALLEPSGDDRPVRRFSINLPADHPLQPTLPIAPHRGLTLSSDGRLLVYVGQSGATTQLFKRSLDRVEVEPMPGTEGAWYPFFSPDNQWVAFFDRESRTLEKVSLTGAAPQALADLPAGASIGLGGSWGTDGTIVYAAAGEGLLKVSEHGGTPISVSAPFEGEIYRGFPSHLPASHAVLVMYSAGIGASRRRIGSVDLETGKLTPLLEPASMPRYVPTGHLVFSQQGHLMAAKFDLETLSVTGPLVRVTEARMQPAQGDPWEWDFSDDGTLVFAIGRDSFDSGRKAVWVDRSGEQIELEMNPVAGTDWARLSPDGTHIVYGSIDQAGNWAIYLFDMENKSNRRLTFDSAHSNPVFHPDGKRVLFSSRQQGTRRIFELDLTRGGPQSLGEETFGVARSLSPDGDLVFFDRAGDSPTLEGIGVFSRSEGTATMLLEHDTTARYPNLSPDGHWLAYQSNTSGRSEIYVRPFPAFDTTYQVSSLGGSFPVWSAAGDQLYYRQGRALVMVPVDTSDGFGFHSPEVLFEGPFDIQNESFDVSPDGQHFLMLQPAVQGVHELIVVENWFSELKRLVPTD